jgi:type IV secretory pathway TraG/TraD family ATPase VirD4
MTPEPSGGHAVRYLSLALFAALLAMPAAWAAGLVPALVVGFVAAAAARLAIGRVRRARRAASMAAPGAAVVLGVSPSGHAVRVSDRQLAAHALIVGASGAGKSTTMLGIVADQIGRGAPVVVIDMKGSPAFQARLREAALAAGRELRVWTPDGPARWNPLAHGNATALKDKLISTERFSEPHYQRAAERYVQTALQVLHAAHPDRAAELDEVVALLEPRRMAGLLRDVPPALAERVQDYLAGLTHDQVSAVRGLGTRLALLSESSAGRYLAGGPGSIDLGAALEGGDVVLFSVNSSVYGKLAAQLGALAIQDLVSAAGHRLARERDPGRPAVQATVAIDEFSALGADNLLALLARGREAGVSVLLATQELSDLERAAPGFRDQVLGITAVKIAHRQDVPSSAHTIASMAGTERVWERTEQVRSPLGAPGASRGTRRQVERFIVDPNEIKTLRTGHAVVLTKTPSAQVSRVQVRPPPRDGRDARGGGARGGGARGRDQPAPGVTR